MAQSSPSPTISPAMITTHGPTPPPPPPPPPTPPHTGFNVMVIVAAMSCALVCALGLNSMLQCVFQCTHRAIAQPAEWIASRRQNSGINKKEMATLPTSTYNTRSGSPSPSSLSALSCAICLADFSDGDKIRLLPKCNHRFHVVCIDKWLLSHSSCPTCRQRFKSDDFSMPSHDQIFTTS
ncbi:hypothetical protein JCGZ_18194 [Jatropha curcas]|uniref:RING-type E3 ubiquitin transferase n=1 Tax=Jatropha curcas TaxID=180498 RepID=A0A067K1R6_JATCU|nr:hypothetical protein JCGZ_18194 [Jatropha curcas]